MQLKLLSDLWNEADVVGMDDPEKLRYRSNLLGSDLRLTNFGGGNTSAKLKMSDPIAGEEVNVLWVKGSGGDLGSIKRDGFATVYMDKLLALKQRYEGVHQEDAMADMYSLCTFNNNPRAASIDTPLHGFLPFPHVDHLHPDWAIAVAACANGPAQLKAIEEEVGLRLAWLPWKRPGFELGLWLERAYREDPSIDGIILGSHGLFTWGETCRECYLSTLRVVDGIGQFVLKRQEVAGAAIFGGLRLQPRDDRRDIAADVMPKIRGLVGPSIGHFDDSDTVLRFIGSHRAEALAWQGTSCPDHFVRTKVRPLMVAWDPADGTSESLALAMEEGIAKYELDYRSYYESCKHSDSPPIRQATPSVVLVPGVGMFSFSRNKAEARITSEFYINAIHVMEGATTMGDLPAQEGIPDEQVVDNYVALPPQEAFNIEYWSLEEAKLRRMPAEKELSRKVAFLIGGGPGIGMKTAELLLEGGAHLVIGDIRKEAAEETAAELRKKYGKESVIATPIDITSRESVRDAYRVALMQFGGLDILVCIAAIFVPPDLKGRISDEMFRKTLDVNILGSFIVAEEAGAVMAKQGTRGSIVLVTSANAVVAKKGSIAYDTSKAAVSHMVRELAVTFAPKVRVNGVAPASVVEGSTMFPRERLMSSLAKYSIPFEDTDTTERLSDKLTQFYADRTLLKIPVGPGHVAQMNYLLCTDRMGLTTGQVFAVDGGLPEAFLR